LASQPEVVYFTRVTRLSQISLRGNTPPWLGTAALDAQVNKAV
jgi:hypothetical protein